MTAIYTAATGMNASQNQLTLIANNMANANTNGFKKSTMIFNDLLYNNIERAGSKTLGDGGIAPSGLQIGRGVEISATRKDFSQGDMKITDNQLDLAINGNGFFRVTLPNGTQAYTRDGAFTTNANGTIVNSNGYELDPQITVPENALSIIINDNGEVQAEIANQVAYQPLGQITLSAFLNPTGLNAIGKNLYLETNASGPPNEGIPGVDGYGTSTQGMLESANINTILELTEMIAVQRHYEMNSKTIQKDEEAHKTKMNAFNV